MTGPVEVSARHRGPIARLRWAIAVLVASQALVVGLQVIGRLVLRRPFPWTEEVARLLLGWLMCAGGISALRHGQHPRVTALLRLLPDPRRRAVDRGLRLVLLGFFLSLVGPAWRLTVAERRRAASRQRSLGRGDLRRASGGSAPDVRRRDRADLGRRDRGLARSRVARLVAGRGRAGARVRARAAPVRRGADRGAGLRLPRDRGARRAARLHARADLAHLPGRHRRRQPDHPADQDPRRHRLVRPARDPAVHPGRRADGDRRHLGADRRPRDGHRRARARRARDGRGRGGDPLLGHLGLDRRRRVRDQLAARSVDAQGRLLRPGSGQRRRRLVRDGHSRAAVPDDGGAGIAGEPLDRHAVPGRVRAGLRARRGIARADCACARDGRDGRSRAGRRGHRWRGPPAAPPCRSACR